MLVNWFISIGMNQQQHIHKVMVIFRFENLEIWQLAIKIADKLFDIADNLEQGNYSDLQSKYEVPE